MKSLNEFMGGRSWRTLIAILAILVLFATLASSGLAPLTSVIVFLVIGIFMFASGLMWLRRRMLIRNTPTSKIRSLAMGLVEIFGQVVPERQVFRGPFSGNDCVYYKYTVEEYRSQGKSSSWVMVKQGEERARFYLKDETGRVLVDPKGAEIDISKDCEFDSGGRDDPPKSVLGFLEREGLNHEGFFGFNKMMRFREYAIAPGDSIYVMGTAGDNPSVEEGSAAEHVEDIMVQKGVSDKFYYISDKPEKKILRSLLWKSMLALLGGIGLIALCLFLLLAFFNFLG